MEIKYRNNKMELTAGDRILDNGACYQVITRTPSFNMHTLRTKKLIKEGKLVIAEKKYSSRLAGHNTKYDLYRIPEGD